MKIRHTKILSIIFAFLIAVSSVVAQTDTNALRQKLQTNLDEWHKSGKFPGATLGVCLADGNCFGLATGFSDTESKTAMKPDDIMLAGSVGKTYVAAVALQLVKEGKINLDERIEKYLGQEKWFSRLPNAKDVTVRQLMNHTSGLIRYEFKDQFTKDLTANPDKTWKPEELLAYLFDEKAPFEAGKGWDYSDTNYIVLGMIIEKVTGKTYYDLAKTRVLKPLKLTRTFPQDSRTINGLVQGYAGAENPFGGRDKVLENGKFIINPQFEWTGGGMATTSEELARWAKFMYEGKAFDASLLPQMLEGVSAPMLGRETKYGLGAIIRPTRAGLAYGHSGFFPGYMTEMMYFPEQRIAVAVMVNTSVFQNLGKPLGRVLVETYETITGKQAPQTTQTTTDETQAEKRYFDFLIGEWAVEKVETSAGVTTGDDVFKFSKVLDGNGILSEWTYNRGTKDKPNYAKGMYMSSFDTLTKNWSFYFISDRSGQYYEGKKENGRWNFYKKFKLESGEEFLQRQWWHSPDASTLIRKIENSKDEGKTWEPIILMTFKRKNAEPKQASTTPKKQFVIVLRLNPKYQDEKNWTGADNEAVERHFAKLQQLEKDGKLIFAGRTLNKESMGVVILEAETEAEARAVMEADDAVKAGIMSAEVLPFQTALIRENK